MADKKRFPDDFSRITDSLLASFKILMADAPHNNTYYATLGQLAAFFGSGPGGGSYSSIVPVDFTINSEGHLIITFNDGTIRDAGVTGSKSAYQSYLDTTLDNPKKTEGEWIESLKGERGADGKDGESAPIGTVWSFKGYLEDIPTLFPNWHVMDGSTVPGYGIVPDARKSFLVGADPNDAAYQVGATGGSNTVVIARTNLPSDVLGYIGDKGNGWPNGSADTTTVGATNSYVTKTKQLILGAGTPLDVRPKYYALFHVIKVSNAGESSSTDAMKKSVYDQNNNGIVDDSEKLGGSTKAQVISLAQSGMVPAEAGKKLITFAQSDKIDNINNQYRGKFTSLEALQMAIPSGRYGDTADIDDGNTSNQYVWDSINLVWMLGSQHSTTVDQSIVEGSINAVSGGSVFTALAGKLAASKAAIENWLTGKITTHWHSFNDLEDAPVMSDYVQNVPGKSLIADTEIARLASVYNVDISGKENVGVAAQLISDLKAGVPVAGDTLLKLFNEIGLKINRTETLTATEIQLLVSNLVDSSPETLNTLNELAAALANDPNFATTITTLIGTKLNASKAAIEALLTGLISSHYHTAAATTFAPTATITATDVQSAIEEVESNANGKISPKPASGTAPYTIGQQVEGGVVYYIFQPGDHGYIPGFQICLIVSLEDRSAGVQWSPGYAVTTATATGIGYGLANTLAILDNHLSVEWYAAKLCSYTPDSGYNDWYLPTTDEMKKLVQNRALTGLGNLNKDYWTSSEMSEQYATVVYSDMETNSIQKNQSYAVRAIRTSVLVLGYSLPVDGEIIVASGNDGKEVKGSGISFSQLVIQTRIYQKSFTDNSTNGVMNNTTFLIEGKKDFLIPEDMDLTHDYTIYDGGIMVKPTIDLVTRIATFSSVPLYENEITYKYYALIN